MDDADNASEPPLWQAFAVGSVGGFCMLLAGGVINCKSSRQHCITMSSCEAELVALADCAIELIHVIGVLKFLGHDLTKEPIEVECRTVKGEQFTIRADAQGSVDDFKKRVVASRSKGPQSSVSNVVFQGKILKDGTLKDAGVKHKAPSTPGDAEACLLSTVPGVWNWRA